MERMTTRRLRIVMACVAASLSAPDARADIDGAYANATTWYFDISHVPDFDQKRTVLANDGKNHCVPTSAINWMAYFANHGRPSIAPGPGLWYAPDRYDDASDAIFTMGAYMSTSGASGTNAAGAHHGLWLWLLGEPVVSSHSLSNGAWSPKLQDAAAW
jgi:hypothetical protein